MESSLKIFVPHGVEALLNAHHTQHITASYLNPLTKHASYNSCCNNFNPAPPLPSSTDDTPHDCLTLPDLLLTPCDDLQETLWITWLLVVYQWLLFKSNANAKYYAGYALATPFEIIEMVPLPLAPLAQWAALYALAQACIFNQGQNCKYYVKYVRR